MIRCVVFDFDGTLVLSNRIKREGFLIVAAERESGPVVMERILTSPPGDRQAILASFAHECGGDPLSMVEAYSRWCESQILACPEREGVSILLPRLRELGLRVYINSATPTIPLKQIVSRRYPQNTFDGVFGGHGCKLANLLTIMAESQCRNVETLMVGDGTDDYQAAIASGCKFWGIADGTLAYSGWRGNLHSDFHDFESNLDLPLFG